MHKGHAKTPEQSRRFQPYTQTNVCMYVYMYVYMYICMYVCWSTPCNPLDNLPVKQT